MTPVFAEVSFVEPWWVQIIKSLVLFGIAVQIVPIVLLAERKLLGRFQHRYGPNRVGPFGAAQPLADIIKLATKEDFRPSTSIGFLYALAPIISLLTAFAAFAILPFGDVANIFGQDVGLYGIDVGIGVLYVFAFGAVAFYGLMLGGWASGSKYSFLGAMRAAAQLISYEVAMGLSLVGVLMMAGTLSLPAIVEAQSNMWYVVPQFVGFLIFLVSAFAETNRAPFDLPEADAELVAGYNTEYGGSKFASYFFAEYVNILVVSGIAVTMFLGGWQLPFVDPPGWVDPFVVFGKIFVFVFLFVWIRATLPRLRYDQLMSFGWKILLPLATLNALVTAIVVVAVVMTWNPGDDMIVVQRAPPPGGAGGAYRTFGETLRGLKTTMARLFEGPKTISYPEEKVPVYPRFRGRHKLHRFEDTGLEKCVGCSLCAAACPADCIRVVAAENTPGKPRQRRRALRRRLRDQPLALHLLRLLRGRVPVRRDHDGPRLRDVRLQPLGPHLHEGDAARRAARAHAAAQRGRVAAKTPPPSLQCRFGLTTIGGAMTKGLDGRVALVTGGASGIGRATAMMFAMHGASVALADVDNGGGEETAELIRDQDGRCLYVRTDVSQAEEVDALVRRPCRISAACTTPSTPPRSRATSARPATAPRTTGIARSPRTSRACGCACARRSRRCSRAVGGSIVNASSVAGLVGYPGLPAYSAAKGGVVQLTRTAAVEYAKAGIRVNAVCPGAIRTPMLENLVAKHPELEAGLLALHPVGRIGEPDEIAHAVVWLCSEGASFITGQALPVDGGWTVP